MLELTVQFLAHLGGRTLHGHLTSRDVFRSCLAIL